jgi:subtilisin family serine protease
LVLFLFTWKLIVAHVGNQTLLITIKKRFMAKRQAKKASKANYGSKSASVRQPASYKTIKNPTSAETPGIRSTNGQNVPTTGKFIIIYKSDVIKRPNEVRQFLANKAGIKHFPTTSDFADGAISSHELETNAAVNFENLGIAVVSGEEEAISLSQTISDANSPILAIEPELLAFCNSRFSGLEYVRGYRDGISQLYEALKGEPSKGQLLVEEEELIFNDSDLFTWGLQATNVHKCTFSGRGIRVAVLDTGFNLDHPDFRGRAITAASFSGAPVEDIHAHGTHCIGTSCGPQKPVTGVRRYGIAFNAEIFAGKVFNDDPRPSASTSNVLAGIEWAITQDCHVASLSLGVAINQKIEQYKTPMRRALNAGLLVVAAAGNNASRPDNPGFVEAPANSDAVMAVAAVDNKLMIAPFSARSSQITGDGGKVNIAGPGVRIFSSVPGAQGNHAFFDGTSMATPHVAGIAALWAEAKQERGTALWARLIQSAKPLGSADDMGAGLVQAP